MNWLFAVSLRSGKRAAALMSLIQSAKLNGHDPFAYLKCVFARLPTQRAIESESPRDALSFALQILATQSESSKSSSRIR